MIIKEIKSRRCMYKRGHLLVLRRRLVIKTIIYNYVSRRKDAGSQIQVREDAQSV